MLPDILDITRLRRLYAAGDVTPLDVVEAIIARIAAWPDAAVWISRVPDEALRQAARGLTARGPSAEEPLWGIPFAVKDNIDCAGPETTAGCAAFAYRPSEDAPVVARLKAAGALLIGKTNLDQFATGLNGTRSPYGAPRTVFNSAYISGGSSSGSAVAVAAGLVSFALGTDTAGSGRVPAAFNNIVGIKPTRGALSARGLVPACRSLDCISILAATAGDGELIRRIVTQFDAQDPYSRAGAQRPLPQAGLRAGVLSANEREFCGDDEAARLYQQAIDNMAALGVSMVEIDYAPFREAAALLYDGPWVAERLAAIEDFIEAHSAEMDPTVYGIISRARAYSAVDAFRGQYKLLEFARRAEAEWARCDVLLLPTAPTIYTVEAMQADPLRLNARLGLYTNFVNLLDCAAIAVPAGFKADGLPFGVSLIAPAFHDAALAELGERLHRSCACGMGRDRQAVLPDSLLSEAKTNDDRISLFVVGAHLSGMPLNHELTKRGGVLIRRCRSAPCYRLFALAGTVPPKPGLSHSPGFVGPGIEGEVWNLGAADFGSFVASIPAPLGIGKVALEGGDVVSGFICESYGLADAFEVTHYGGWRAYRTSIEAPV